jgi:hypothetical protein
VVSPWHSTALACGGHLILSSRSLLVISPSTAPARLATYRRAVSKLLSLPPFSWHQSTPCLSIHTSVFHSSSTSSSLPTILSAWCRASSTVYTGLAGTWVSIKMIEYELEDMANIHVKLTHMLASQNKWLLDFLSGFRGWSLIYDFDIRA